MKTKTLSSLRNQHMEFVSLDSLCTDVIDCPHSTPKWKESGIPVIRNFNLVDGHIDTSKLSYVDQETYETRVKRAKPEPGDIIISREAPMGVVGIVPNNFKCCLGQRLVLLKVDRTKCDPEYLLYTLLSPVVQTQINRIDATGSTVSNLNIPDLKQLSIPMIDGNASEIAHTLKIIDQKIANNNAISAKLEAMVKTIYDYWFLQFEFPNVGGNPYKSSGGEMVWNDELQREIPAGWEVDNLGNHFDVSKGTPLTASDAKLDGPYKVVSAGLDYAYHHNEYNREKDTISISTSGANAGFVRYWHERIYANDCITIRHNNVSNTIYAYNFLKAIQNYLYSQACGSAQPHVYPADISTLKLVIPPVEIMERFAKIIGPQNSNLEVIQKQNQQLASLRDFLLPMLMNGQVIVNE